MTSPPLLIGLYALLRQQLSYLRNCTQPDTFYILIDNESTREQILNAVNQIWDSGLGFGMQTLPKIIVAPNATPYRTDYCLETVRHVKETPALFFWMRATTLLPYSIPDVEYVVPFYIPSAHPYHVLDLAWFLCRFMDKYIRQHYVRFKLLSFAFKLDSQGTYGLLLFDRKLRFAFNRADRLSRADTRYTAMDFDIPMSTWPADCHFLREPQVIFNLKHHAELLARA